MSYNDYAKFYLGVGIVILLLLVLRFTDISGGLHLGMVFVGLILSFYLLRRFGEKSIARRSG
ncbi:hypothetical protein FLK61_23235 [Paenalkalicoccus suaedae]|uniref:Uncharacterized protein n=1 Tax=Paenalkalicoccus suaedae TaxID=2592382 RepID=A0A859FBP3_9BACI|nr:hypothetical protein [Paenalkalicoccus suaedae]QKS69715.1 hypothetical protein FLK61_23235 [Paenalkalicoccus suaedae]